MTETRQLRSDIQSLVDQFVIFREEYLSLVAKNAAQETLIRMQQVELNTSRRVAGVQRTRMSDILNTLTSAKKEISTLIHAKTENVRLSSSLSALQREYDDFRSSNDKLTEQLKRSHEEQIRSLDDQLALGRTQLALEEERTRESINCLVLEYESKLQDANIARQDTGQARLMLAEEKHRESIKRLVEEYEGKLHAANLKAAQQLTEHNVKAEPQDPAQQRNKKLAPSNKKWPELDITGNSTVPSSVKRRSGPANSKKRKLYILDAETTVDIN